jgi:hypothetical protein
MGLKGEIIMTIHYDGRVFRSTAPETAGPDATGPTGHYRQQDNLVWAEFAGGRVVRGSLVGTCRPDGRIELAYCQVLVGGETVSGRCTSTPEVLSDGRIRLREDWQRYGPAAGTGVSYIEEVAADHG